MRDQKRKHKCPLRLEIVLYGYGQYFFIILCARFDDDADWQQFVANKIATWEEMNTHWARNYTGDLHIVYYDDLVADVEGSLRKILNFIRFPINEVSANIVFIVVVWWFTRLCNYTQDQLACAVARKEGIYRRKKRIMTFDPFTPEMHIVLEQRKRHVYTALGRNRF